MLLIIPRLYVIFPLQIVIVFVCTHFQERSLFPLLLLSRPFMVFLNPPSILCERSKRSRFKQWFTSHSFFTHTWVSKGQFGRLNEIFKQLLSRPVVSREVDSWPVPDSAYPTAVISTDFFFIHYIYIYYSLFDLKFQTFSTTHPSYGFSRLSPAVRTLSRPAVTIACTVGPHGPAVRGLISEHAGYPYFSSLHARSDI